MSSPIPTTSYVGLALTHPGEDSWGEPSGDAYARVPVNLQWITDGNHFLYNNVEISFPRATGDGWGTTIGAILYDSITTGNVLFDLPFMTSASGTQITSYPVTSGCRVYFPAYNILLAIRGKHLVGESYDVANGGVSVDYTRIIMQWLASMTTVPLNQRVYDMAIGRNATYDAFGKFAGIWTECSGAGYQKRTQDYCTWCGRGHGYHRGLGDDTSAKAQCFKGFS